MYERYEKPTISMLAELADRFNYDFNPNAIPAYVALGCKSTETPSKLVYNDRNMDPLKQAKKIERITKETSGRGHLSTREFSEFLFELENVPRLVTLHLCQNMHLSPMQQSMRFTDATRGYYLPESLKNDEEIIGVMDDAFSMYNEMKDDGIPTEDARYILPLYSRTNINIKGNIRALDSSLSKKGYHPSVLNDVNDDFIELIRGKSPTVLNESKIASETLIHYPNSDYSNPSNDFVKKILCKYDSGTRMIAHNGLELSNKILEDAIKNKNTAELSNLRHVNFTFMIKGSLAEKHQEIRQRMIKPSMESIYDAAERGNGVIPNTIKKDYRSEFSRMHSRMVRLVNNIDSNVPKKDLIGLLPHSLETYTVVEIDGWNALNFYGERGCTKAQWEIRDIAQKVRKEIREVYPELAEYMKPRCQMLGECKEKEQCGLYNV